MERHCARCHRDEHRRPALRGSRRQHSGELDHRTQQDARAGRGHLGHHQRHRRATGRTAADGHRHLSHRRRNGRRGRPGENHHRRLHRDLPHEAERRHRQRQHPSGRRHRGAVVHRTGHLREAIQRWHGQQRTHFGTPRRLCQVSGREISRELRPQRARRVGLQRQIQAHRRR